MTSRSPDATGPAPRPYVPVPRVRIGEDRGRPALLVNGVVQSVAPASAIGGYWEAMLPANRPRRTLLLGLGGGTLAHLLAERFRGARMVAVDDDPEVVAVAHDAFGPLPADLQIVLADAFRFIEGCHEAFDFVAVDLFHGAAMPPATLALPFLRSLREALAPGGRTAFNVFNAFNTDQRLTRLRRVFRVEAETIIRDNLVIHCRRP